MSKLARSSASWLPRLTSTAEADDELGRKGVPDSKWIRNARTSAYALEGLRNDGLPAKGGRRPVNGEADIGGGGGVNNCCFAVSWEPRICNW